MPRIAWGGSTYLRSKRIHSSLVHPGLRYILVSSPFSFLHGSVTLMPAGKQAHGPGLSSSQTSNTIWPLKPPSNIRVWRNLSRKASRSQPSLSPLKNLPPPLLWATSPSFDQPPPKCMPLHPGAILASPGDQWSTPLTDLLTRRPRESRISYPQRLDPCTPLP